ncbi:MAG: IS110 family transposase [Phyllobacterium sp.]|uniref:IS110 family transposase n=1 Tax=Phyllobacterium sp. TaxID=1871046 RepID=UPI0030F199F8
MKITTIGLDLAKNVFQVHGVDAEGNVTVRRRLRRKEVLLFFGGLEPCLIGLEACGSAHFWARELAALGHDVRIMPPSYVKAYVRRGKKNDAADAAAICEAVTRPNMRFVPIKTEVQQTALMLHKSRDLLIRQQNMLVNAVRGHAAELGLVAAQGRGKVEDIIAAVEADDDDSLPTLARAALRPLVAQLRTNEKAIAELDAEIKAWHTQNEMSRRLATIPGVGVLTASAIAATVPDPSFFRSGREFAAWLGLVPRQNSSGGKERLGRISKQGNRYIRRMLVIGATGMLRYARAKSAPGAQWVNGLLERRPPRLVTVAMANKMARIAWAIMTRQETFRAPATAA